MPYQCWNCKQWVDENTFHICPNPQYGSMANQCYGCQIWTIQPELKRIADALEKLVEQKKENVV